MGILYTKGTWLFYCLVLPMVLFGQNKPSAPDGATTSPLTGGITNPALYQNLQWRCIGPFRGGRSVAVCGVPNQPQVYYMGATGGGLWKTEDGGINWRNISDAYFQSGSVGAIAVAEKDPNVVYVGMGEHPVRGVMTSHGDGMYKSLDAGKTWKHIGLNLSRQIAAVRIHPENPDIVYVAVQGAIYGPSEERGIYKSIDGGETWRKVLFVNNHTGACDLSIDWHNPRVLYAGMWDHQRNPWSIRSGGPGSGLYKSTDEGETWFKLTDGLPKQMGKVAIDVSRANPNRVYANIEAEKGGVFRSDDGGQSWIQTNSRRVTVARAWYYIEIFADPQDEETVYVLNDPVLKSIDGGKTFEEIHTAHSDQHDLWINPDAPNNFILANDGGACITFNGGQSWSTQDNQPTGQFYRVIADNRFPYYIYGGQQDNSTVAIASRSADAGISGADWYPVSGCESGFIAFNPDDPERVYGGCYLGQISVYDHATKMEKDVMAYPELGLGTLPRDMKYRFNWNAPIVVSPQQPQIIYQGGNVVFRSSDGGANWEIISRDLTRNDPEKQGPGGGPFTNEGAGGEVYNTISYIACSPLQQGLLWVGSDDGLVHLTRDDGKTWTNVSPPDLGEALINSIEASPHAPGTAYVAANRYRWDDLCPLIYVTEDYGAHWRKITDGIGSEDFTRVVREDPVQSGLLFAGTESGFYISFNKGKQWVRFPLNLPACPITDLAIHDNDLIASTSGRAFWILDDIGPIRQSMGRLLNGHVRLFAPKPTYRFDAATPPKPIAGLGQNPSTGVIISYYLPSDMDSIGLQLQILDSKGKLVRQYSNLVDKGFVTYEGGPEPPVVFPAKKGLNRFNWDLRREPVINVPGILLPVNYRGGLVGPGTYTIRLVTPKDTFEQTVEVLPDPRIKADPNSYEKQQEALTLIQETVRDIHLRVIAMREVKQQVDLMVSTLSKLDGFQELAGAGKNIGKKIDEWESLLIQPKQETYQDVINFPNKLNAELMTLLRKADTADPTLTQGVNTRLKDLLGKWAAARQTMQSILDNDIAAFNELHRNKNIPAIVVPGIASFR